MGLELLAFLPWISVDSHLFFLEEGLLSWGLTFQLHGR